jgi:transposase
MKTVELYARVRRAVSVDGMNRRAAAREFGLARKTVHKMLEYSAPPGYQRQKPVRRPKLGPWQGVIDAILEDDKQRPRKQRHTAKRIFERLRAKHSYTGGYTMVKDYVRAFEYFGGVPTRILYDNTKLAVARILGDGKRKKTRAFSELQSHYLFAEKFGRPAKGNDKPGPHGQVFVRGVARARWRTLLVTCGVTSWRRFRARQAGRRSTSSLCGTPWLAVRNGCAVTRRPSANASSATVPCCCRCPRRASL